MASLLSSELQARVANTLTAPNAAALAEKRETTPSSSSSTIDSINLNVDDPQGITMTFVETSEDED